MFKKRNGNDDAINAVQKELHSLQARREALSERLAQAHKETDAALDART